MDSFDIESLLRFTPPRRLCQKCYGLHSDMPLDNKYTKLTCRACGVDYLATDCYSVWDAQRYFDARGLSLQFEDVVAHSRTLAGIARRMHNFSVAPTTLPYSQFPPIVCLLDALHAAQQFVHFTTYGMSLQLVGAIRMTALRVPVRGIISNVSTVLADEFTRYGQESPKLEVKLFERSGNKEDWDAAPHQKVIVIDGLLAFKGSANLTVEGWRKAAQGLDSVEVVTDVKEVVELNNRLFSRVWSHFSDIKAIHMEEEELPF
jgi:phosphatidylserine/phosphatidylglycerophosphate/cardiolipin synthase-like enzyme